MCVLGLDLLIDKVVGEDVVRYFNSVNIARWNYYLKFGTSKCEIWKCNRMECMTELLSFACN
jgi:hypothetical protein